MPTFVLKIGDMALEVTVIVLWFVGIFLLCRDADHGNGGSIESFKNHTMLSWFTVLPLIKMIIV